MDSYPGEVVKQHDRNFSLKIYKPKNEYDLKGFNDNGTMTSVRSGLEKLNTPPAIINLITRLNASVAQPSGQSWKDANLPQMNPRDDPQADSAY